MFDIKSQSSCFQDTRIVHDPLVRAHTFTYTSTHPMRSLTADLFSNLMFDRCYPRYLGATTMICTRARTSTTRSFLY